MKPFLSACLLLCLGWLHAATPGEIDAARGVIARFAGDTVAQSLTLSSIPDVEGRHVYEIDDNGRTLRGSSAVALCKAFYANVKAKGAGICSWTGNRFDDGAVFTPSQPVRVVAPFRHYQYFNVVTFGYSLPFWDEARWMREIDWMALHGFDMPLALIAYEAIAERVWKRLGLSDEEIDAYLVGPAHLPWMRMGNLSERPDGPLPKAWRERSVRLQHAVLQRMRALGMKPVVLGFAGFVPQGIARLHPEARLLKMRWSGFHSWFLSPDQPLFRTLGKMYVEEWEKEFGPCEYWLADSFNEMELPWETEEEKLEGLAHCGENVFGAIQDGHPGATWVMTGWMFGYQRHIWTPARFNALLRRIPDDRVLLFDMAVDYNMHFWHNGTNWDLFKGFGGKPWVWSTIPNMGGKVANTGILEFYANGHLPALSSPNRGKLVGYGTAPEGIENNEVLYELITDAGWRDTPLNLREWLQNYTRCRYGASPEPLTRYWEGMLASVYGSFTDHPRYVWQFRPGGSRGSVNANAAYFRAIDAFVEAAPALKDSPLYALDLRENVALAAGAKLETVLRAEALAREEGDTPRVSALRETAATLFKGIDALLEGHPTLDLRNWIAKARAAAEGDQTLADRYETNARRIVTIWGPPVNDYSARIWSGLVGSYYFPRYRLWWEALDNGTSAGLDAFERQWVEQRPPLEETEKAATLSEGERALQLWQTIQKLPADLDRPTPGQAIGQWAPAEVGTEWRELTWDVPSATLKAAKRLRFRYVKGLHRLDIARVTVEMDGVAVQTLEPNGYAGVPSRNNVCTLNLPANATGNNSCRIRAKVRGNGGNDSYGSVELLP